MCGFSERRNCRWQQPLRRQLRARLCVDLGKVCACNTHKISPFGPDHKGSQHDLHDNKRASAQTLHSSQQRGNIWTCMWAADNDRCDWLDTGMRVIFDTSGLINAPLLFRCGLIERDFSWGALSHAVTIFEWNLYANEEARGFSFPFFTPFLQEEFQFGYAAAAGWGYTSCTAP